jgi:hypothetical protein
MITNKRLITDEEKAIIQKAQQELFNFELSKLIINEDILSSQLNVFKTGLFCGFVTYSNN